MALEKINNEYWIAGPENYEGQLDVIVYFPGAQPGGDIVPYEQFVAEHPDKLVIIDSNKNTGGKLNTHIEEIAEVIKEYANQEGVTVGCIDINTHSLDDYIGIPATNYFYDQGFTVNNVTVTDGKDRLAHFGSLPDEVVAKFAETGANLTVFGQPSREVTEKGNLQTFIDYGVPLYYVECISSSPTNWDDTHAAINQSPLLNGYMGVLDGTASTITLDPVAVNTNGVQIVGYNFQKFDYDTYNSLGGNKNVSLKGWADMSEEEAMANFGAKSYLYNGGLVPTLSPLIGNVHEEMDHMLMMVSAFSGTFNDSLTPLPKSDNLVVCKEELLAFKSSGVLTDLQSTIGEASNLQNLINAFKTNGLLKGDVWNLAYDKLDVYDEALAKMAEAAANLGSSIEKAVDELLACYNRYPDIPADKIQTGNLATLNVEIAGLREELSGIPPETTWTDPETGEESVIPNPKYVELENQINELQHLIDAITDFKETYERVKIELDAAMEELREFGNMISGINPSSSYSYTQ